MTPTLKHSLVVLTLALAGLTGCGGSSSSEGPGGPTGPTGPGATANLSLKGVITSASTAGIEVGGIAVAATANTVTRIEKVEKQESELKVGMVVKVKAHRNGAGREAEGLEIEFEDDVKGRVSGKDDALGTITVGGQTVRVDDSTHFTDDSARLASVSVGQRVRVSGVADDKGGLRATRIDDDSGVSEDFEVKGVVSARGATSFTLTTVAGVVYTVNMASGDVPAGVVDGGFVEVRAAGPAVGGVLTATSVSVEDRLPGLPNVENHIDGIVTAIPTAGATPTFVINGTTVVTDASTRWDGGVPDDLVLGVKVEAEGVLAVDGTLSADKVKFKDYIKLVGAPASISVDGGGLGTFTVNGVAATVDRLTRQDDSLNDVGAGDFVEARAMLARDGVSVVVTRIRIRNDDRPIVQGLVTAVSGDTLTILGKSIDVSSAQLRNFRVSDSADGPIFANRADFFAAIVVGQTVVKARGANPAALSGNSLTAEEAELEGER